MSTIADLPVGTVFRIGSMVMQKVTDAQITEPIKDSNPNVINLVNGHRCTMLSSLEVTPLGPEYPVYASTELPPVTPLAIQRALGEDTRLQEVYIGGRVYSLHRTGREVLVTDTRDYTQIYQVTSRSFWDRLEDKE